MVRGFDNDLVRADAIHLVVETFALSVERPLDSQGRKFVGHDTERPARSIRRRAIVAVSEHLRRGLALVPIAKGAKAGTADLYFVADKVRRALGPVGCDDNPPAGDGILTQFWQLDLLR